MESSRESSALNMKILARGLSNSIYLKRRRRRKKGSFCTKVLYIRLKARLAREFKTSHIDYFTIRFIGESVHLLSRKTDLCLYHPFYQVGWKEFRNFYTEREQIQFIAKIAIKILEDLAHLVQYVEADLYYSKLKEKKNHETC